MQKSAARVAFATSCDRIAFLGPIMRLELGATGRLGAGRPFYFAVSVRALFPSRRQLLANAAIAASRVGL